MNKIRKLLGRSMMHFRMDIGIFLSLLQWLKAIFIWLKLQLFHRGSNMTEENIVFCFWHYNFSNTKGFNSERFKKEVQESNQKFFTQPRKDSKINSDICSDWEKWFRPRTFQHSLVHAFRCCIFTQWIMLAYT